MSSRRSTRVGVAVNEPSVCDWKVTDRDLLCALGAEEPTCSHCGRQNRVHKFKGNMFRVLIFHFSVRIADFDFDCRPVYFYLQ
jgi:hypothetical protein